jgi:hypothetical protein
MKRLPMLMSAGFFALMSVTLPVQAAETVTYTYDAKGRLTKVVRAGTVNNNVQTTYTYDRMGNRINTGTTGSNNNSAPP